MEDIEKVIERLKETNHNIIAAIVMIVIVCLAIFLASAYHAGITNERLERLERLNGIDSIGRKTQ